MMTLFNPILSMITLGMELVVFSAILSGAPAPRPAMRRLTQDELATAISSALQGEGGLSIASSGGIPFALSAPVYVSHADPGLQVLRIENDAVRQVTRFCLVASREPGLLPFYVSISNPVLQGSLPSLYPLTQAAIRGQRSGSDATKAVKPIYLVRQGRRATLTVNSGAVQISVSVIPLDSGAMGERIRARNPDSQRLIVANVAGEDLLVKADQH